MIVYYSVSGNTKKICEFLSKELKIPIKNIYEVKELEDFTILGFPVHFSKPPKPILKKLESLDLRGKKFFIIITYGMPHLGKLTAILAYLVIKRIIEKKGGKVLGKFICPGRHTIIKFLNKNRPNERDLEEALKALSNFSHLLH